MGKPNLFLGVSYCVYNRSIGSLRLCLDEGFVEGKGKENENGIPDPMVLNDGIV